MADSNFNSDIPFDTYSSVCRSRDWHVVPYLVCVIFDNEGGNPELSTIATRCNAPVYLLLVAMSDGRTLLVVTAEAAAKANKAIKECTMMPEGSTREELGTHQYLL